jgi:ferritin-like metal-binding protein YciE
MDATQPRPVPDDAADKAELLALATRDWISATAGHMRAIEHYDALCMDILRTIADGKGLADVVQLVGDSMNECDHIDDEAEALWDRARDVAEGRAA